jgi:hypothetical protein
MEDELTERSGSGDQTLSLSGSEAKEGRCEECGVKLSRYNRGPNCWQHTLGRPWRGPTAKPRF